MDTEAAAVGFSPPREPVHSGRVSPRPLHCRHFPHTTITTTITTLTTITNPTSNPHDSKDVEAGYNPPWQSTWDSPPTEESGDAPMDDDAAAAGSAAAAPITCPGTMAPVATPGVFAASAAAASAAAAILAAVPDSPDAGSGGLGSDSDGSDDGGGGGAPPELTLAASSRGATGRAIRPAEAAADRQPVDAGVGVEGVLNVTVASRRGDGDGAGVLRLEDMLPRLAPRRGVSATADADAAAAADATAAASDAAAAVAAGGLTGTAAKELRKKLSSAASTRALAPPLSAPAAGRVERSAAYAAASAAVTDWQPMVKANRAARTLTFPQHKPLVHGSAAESTAVLARRGVAPPAGGMEAEIDALLASSGVVGSGPGGAGSAADVGGGAAVPADDAALGDETVTMAEAVSRRDELAQMRSTLFHYERKMKRMKKIKSRRFRRALKREKEAAAGGLGDDSEDDSDARGDAAERAERRRVEERMNLRHKNTSKWVRRQLQRKEGSRSDSVRAAIDEQLRIGRELRHKQANTVSLGRSVGRAAGAGGGEDRDGDGESSSGSGSSSDEAGDAAEEAKLGAAIRGGAGGGAAGADGPPAKGLLGLAFMQSAIKRRAEAARTLLEEMDRDARGGGHASEDDDEGAREAGRGRPGAAARVA